MSYPERTSVPNFLCDTWWYSLTQRLSNKKFEELAKLRSDQGFTAVQLVVGIPPEVGPENPNAASEVGPAWNLRGEFNNRYLGLAEERVKLLNSVGLTTIIYGAWGQQIEWLGEKRMEEWWKEIVNRFDKYEVMYCITGESDIWVGEEGKMLPDKTTGELNTVRLMPFLHPRLVYLGKRLINMINKPFYASRVAERREKWSKILTSTSSMTTRPIFIHTLSNRTSENVVNNSELLSAVTVQTGHDAGTRKTLWKLPFEITQNSPNKKYINLEPWYEGISGSFGVEDQLYAYWASMMAGAHAYCYGAHGIWNVGDGKFLSHWGSQTLEQAMRLNTPGLIGKSHNMFIGSGYVEYDNVVVEDKEGEMLRITRTDDNGNYICYVPEVSLVDSLPNGKIFLPLRGEFSKSLPPKGQVVITR